MKRIMLFLWAFMSISVLALAKSGEEVLSAEEKQVMQSDPWTFGCKRAEQH